MTKLILCLAFLFLASSAIITGGWSNLDTNNLGTSAKAALQVAISNVQSTLQSKYGNGNFLQLKGAQSQVVAGIKYKFTLDFNVLIEGDMMFIKSFEVTIWAQPAGYNGANSAEAYVVLGVKSLTDDENNTLNLAIAGGWSNINSDNLDAWADAALKAAIGHVESMFTQNSAVLIGVQSAQTQIVAGQNYKFVLEFNLGTYEVVVWRKLSGEVQVTQVTQLATTQRLGAGLSGGWKNLDVTALSDEAKRAANMAIGHVKQLLQNSAAYNDIEAAQSQIVAGVNYRFHLQFFGNDGGRIHYEVTVWQQLSGVLKVTDAKVAN